MVAPAIAIGIYELLAAGAAATGLGAVAIAKRREMTEGLGSLADDAQDHFLHATAQCVPYIIGTITGIRPWRSLPTTSEIDAGTIETLPLPDFADSTAIDKIAVPRFPVLPITDSDTKSGSDLPPITEMLADDGVPPPPPDPFASFRRTLGKIKAGANRIAQNPWLRRAGTAYKWYVYGSTALTTLEIGRRMVVGGEEHGPVLYDHVYKHLFGESSAARALLGSHQVMAAETTSGMIAIMLAQHLVDKRFAGRLGEAFVKKFLGQLFGFKSAHAYAFLGNLVFFEDQMAANDMSTQHVDIDRASRTATFFGFTSIAFYPLVGVLGNVPRINIGRFVLDGVGRTGFKDWLARYVGPDKVTNLRPTILDYGNRALIGVWQGIQSFLGPRLGAIVAPHYVPRFQTWLMYTGFATVYRNATQALASLPWLEDSNWSESMKMVNARNAISALLTDPYFYLGAKVNSLRSIFGNQLVFMGLIYGLNQFFSRFDGKDIAVNEADRMLQEAAEQGGPGILKVVLSKPLTQRNFFVPPYIDLSVKTWVQLSRQYMDNDRLNAGRVENLSSAAQLLLQSADPDRRRVGMALGVLLTQVSFNPRWHPLRQGLHDIGVVIHPRHAHSALSVGELHQVFEDINDGKYDRTPLFQFPRS